MLLKVDCLPNAVGKQPSIPLIYLGRKWTLNWWWWWWWWHVRCHPVDQGDGFERSRLRGWPPGLRSYNPVQVLHSSVQDFRLILVSGELVAPVTKVHDLGVIIDRELMLILHVDKAVKLCFFHLRQLHLIRQSSTYGTTHALVCAHFLNRLDYCNGVLAGLPINQVTWL